MHHKFMVSDGTNLQLGSFNYTASAAVRNAETALVLRNSPDIARIYREEWIRLTTEPKSSVETIMKVNDALATFKEMGF